MKITNTLKFIMQINSFIGLSAALLLLKLGMKTTLVYAGFGINAYCLLYWIFVKEEGNE